MGIFSRLSAWLTPSPPLAEAERLAIGRAVAAVDPLLKSVPAFERRLAPALRCAREHCAELVAALPGPIDVDVRAFSSDPLVHACFASPADIDAMFGKSRELRDFLADPSGFAANPFYALLGMRRREKNTMGMAMNGDVLQRDVPQRILYFTDHTLAAVGDDLPGIRLRLQQLGVDSLVGSFAARLSGQRRERDDLRLERELERARASARGNSAEGEAHRLRLEAIDEELRRLTEALDPERILDALAAWLTEPSAHLRLEQVSVAVDAMGVEFAALSEGATVHRLNLDEVHFFELIGRDRRRWILLLARINRDAVQRAFEVQLAIEEQASRTLII